MSFWEFSQLELINPPDDFSYFQSELEDVFHFFSGFFFFLLSLIYYIIFRKQNRFSLRKFPSKIYTGINICFFFHIMNMQALQSVLICSAPDSVMLCYDNGEYLSGPMSFSRDISSNSLTRKAI